MIPGRPTFRGAVQYPTILAYLFLGLIGLLDVTSSPAASVEADWPRFLGPNGDNTSSETGLLDRWPTNGPPIVWDREVGIGYGAPSVRGDRLVLHHRVGDEEIVESMDAATGKSHWRYSNLTHYADPYGYNNGPRCAPTLTTNRCYTFGAEGKLTCLDLGTGKLVWQRDTAKDWNVPDAFFGVGSTPLVDAGQVYTMVGGQPDSGMVAFGADTGKTLWESVGEKSWHGKIKTGWRGEPPIDWSREDKQASYSSPVLATIHGQRHLLCLTRQGLVSLNPTNGSVRFVFWFRATVPESVNAMNPIVQDDLILISAAYYRVGTVLARVLPDGKTVATVWRNTNLEIHWNTPIYANGSLYAFSGRNEPDATFRCVDFRTGEIRWERNERWPAHSTLQPAVFGRGSAILADGKIVALGEGGLLGLFKLNSQRDEEVSRWQVPSLHYPCWAAPVLAHHRLFLRCENRLVCLNLAAAKK